MPKTIKIQSNLTRGELSPDMAARIDAEPYYAGLSRAENVVIMPHGGVRRRPGLTKTIDSQLPGKGRMLSFEFSSTQDYLIVLVPGAIRVYKDGVFQVQIASKFVTANQVTELDAVQSGDVMIMSHQDVHPQMLRRQGSSTNWAIIDVPFTAIPTYNFGSGDEPVWSAARGYPGVCTFFQSRLWFAGSTQRPQSIWGSRINGFYNFDMGTAAADHAIFDTIDTDQYNIIVNIFSGRNLQVFTNSSEFYNTTEIITPESSSWKRSTSFGSKRLKPVMIDGSVLFADRLGRTIRRSVFEFQENAYVAPSISLMSEHLIRGVVSIDTVKGTNIDVSDFMYVVNGDGSVAVLNILKVAGVEGWTKWTTQGNFVDVCTVNKIVYFMVERSGEYFLEYMNEGTTLDHNSFKTGQPLVKNNVTHNGDTTNVIYRGRNVVHSLPGSGVRITSIDTEEGAVMAALPHKVILDNSVLPNQFGGVMILPRPAYNVEVGFDVKLRVSTMPVSVPIDSGQTLNEIKRVISVQLNLRDTLGVSAGKSSAPDRTFKVVLDEAPNLFTGQKEVFLLGYDRLTVVDITQEQPLPFKLLAIGYEVEL